MIDTIILHIPEPVHLSSPTKIIQTPRAETTHYKISNLDIRTNQFGTTVTGSLPKFLNGSNVETLKFSEIQMAIDNLSELLRTDVSNGKLLRLDWTDNISTTHPPQSYYSVLGETYPYQRIQVKNSLYYNCNSRKALFYDKGKEAKVPGNYLRYELRNLKPDLKKIDLRLGELLKPNAYNSCVKKWLTTYQRINKLRTIMLREVKTPKDIERASFEWMTNEFGKDGMIRIIQETAMRNNVSPSNKSRMINKVIRVINRNPNETELELELNEKFQEAANKAMV